MRRITPDEYWVRERKFKLNRGVYYDVRLCINGGYFNYELTPKQLRKMKKNGWFWN